MEQARVRAAPEQLDKGGGAAAAALHLIALARRFRGGGTGKPVPDDTGDDIILAGRTGLTRTA